MAITLTELSYILKDKLPKTVFHIKGEVSRPKLYDSGLYFTLKDNNIMINCKIWKSKLTEDIINIVNGDNIEIKAMFDFYKGSLSLTINWAKKLDEGGDLNATFELLKAEFKQKGFFNKKIKLPNFIKKIALITSLKGAAIHDFEYAINNGNSSIEIIKIDAVVQGNECPKQIIDYLNIYDFSECDMIVITRGGGSMEDLWGFNNKALIETVYNRTKPILSAIGHMIDTTLLDFAADISAPTPSLAAQYIIDYNMKYINNIESIKTKTYNNLVYNINKNLSTLDRLAFLKNDIYEKFKRKQTDIKNTIINDIKNTIMKLDMYKLKPNIENNGIILYDTNNKLSFNEFKVITNENKPFILHWNNIIIEINGYKYI